MPMLVATSGSRIPDSLIRKFGFEPVPLSPADAPKTQGVCCVAQGLAQFLHLNASSFAAAVMTTRCDQLRRALECVASDLATPFILLNLPATQNTPASEKQEHDEHTRLEKFLAALSVNPEPNRHRENCRYSPPLPSSKKTPFGEVPATTHFRIGLLACNITASDRNVLNMLESLGMAIVLDLSAQAIPEGCPTIERRPNANFFHWLATEGKTARLDGWILLYQPWCDIYRAEICRLKSAIPLPWLVLETGPEPALASLRTRAGAFLEMIANDRA